MSAFDSQSDPEKLPWQAFSHIFLCLRLMHTALRIRSTYHIVKNIPIDSPAAVDRRSQSCSAHIRMQAPSNFALYFINMRFRDVAPTCPLDRAQHRNKSQYLGLIEPNWVAAVYLKSVSDYARMRRYAPTFSRSLFVPPLNLKSISVRPKW
jgi:hypothetical protein